MAQASNLGRGVLKVQVNDRVTAKDLHSIVDQILNLHGCTTCGLVGIDLRLRGDDLAQLGTLKGLPGVGGVEFSAG